MTLLFKAHTHSSLDATSSLQRDLEIIQGFGKRWTITFNSAKTTQQTFMNKLVSPPPSLTFGNKVIPLVQNHKHLGLNISTDLIFRSHNQKIIKKNASLESLYPIARYHPRQTLLHIYVTYVRPILDYVALYTERTFVCYRFI